MSRRHATTAVPTAALAAAIGYWTLGTVDDAEAVGRATDRWSATFGRRRGQADQDVTVAVRVALDRACRARDDWLGRRLPEPDPDGRFTAALPADVPYAELGLLQTVGPPARVAHLLTRELGYSAAAAADMMECDDATIGVLIELVDNTIGAHLGRRPAAREHATALARFLDAVDVDDPVRWSAVLAPDAVLLTDRPNGERSDVIGPISGALDIAGEVAAIGLDHGRSVRRAWFNRQVGFTRLDPSGWCDLAGSILTDGTRITAIAWTTDPDRLDRLAVRMAQQSRPTPTVGVEH